MINNQEIWQVRREESPKRKNDNRTEWGRDLARLIHSPAFRRLQAKTQVLGLGESDFYRTRLTHSMEVAQIGAGLLKVINEKYPEQKPDLPDPALMQAICLAHDIGHPPFGHGGEVALNFCMREFGGFEGNGQTLRILSRLDKYTDGFGLNPTRRLMLGVLKYPVAYSKLVKPELYPKPTPSLPSWLFKASTQKPPKCFHDSETDVVDFILDSFTSFDRELFVEVDDENGKHKKPKYKSLDTSIMDLADEISYSVHDLEDAISLGMITRENWLAHFKDKENLFDLNDGHDFVETSESLARKLFGRSHERKNCIGKLVNLFITSVELIIQNSNFESPILKYKAALPEKVETLRKWIFDLVKNEVILNENVQQLEFKGQKMIVELFQVLAADPERFLPTSTKQIYLTKGDEQSKNRVICDFVSGMTDDYATRLYEKIFQPRKGSIFDRL